MHIRSILTLLFLLFTLHTYAQSTLTLNTVDAHKGSAILHNPAAAGLLKQGHLYTGFQVLHAGFAEDNLQNYFAAYHLPLGWQSGIGLRAQFFNSNVFGNGYFSLYFNRKFGDRIFLGINSNLISYRYNSSQFRDFDFNDPVFTSRSRNTVSFGISSLFQPTPFLKLGISLDHLNQPDISLNQSGIKQPQVVKFGVMLDKWPVQPQFEWQLDGDDQVMQFSLNNRFMAGRGHGEIGYRQFGSNGSSFFASLGVRSGNWGIHLNYQNVLSEDFSQLSPGGSPQFALSYRFNKKPTPPAIVLDTTAFSNHKTYHSEINISGSIKDKDGVKAVRITRGDSLLSKIDYKGNKAVEEFGETIPLVRGSNIITITAVSNDAKQPLTYQTVFKPLPPQISIVEDSIKSKKDSLFFFVNIRDSIALKKVEINQNDTIIYTNSEPGKIKSLHLPVKTKLAEGENIFQITAKNAWEAATVTDSKYYSKVPELNLVILNETDLPFTQNRELAFEIYLDTADVRKVEIFRNSELIQTPFQRTFPALASRKTRGLEDIRAQDGIWRNNQNIELLEGENIIKTMVTYGKYDSTVYKENKVVYNPYYEKIKYSNIKALLVGIDEYNIKGVNKLDEAVSDSEKMKNLIEKDTTYKNEISTLYDYRATYSNIFSEIPRVIESANEQDLVILYFAMHGDTSDAQNGYLIPYDAKSGDFLTYISIKRIIQLIKNPKARHVLLIFDICFGGLGLRKRPPTYSPYDWQKFDYSALNSQFSQKTISVITAGRNGEKVFDDGRFTQLLVDGIKGKADKNNDYCVSFHELGHYVRKNIQEETNRKQNPQYGQIGNGEGEILFRVKK